MSLTSHVWLSPLYLGISPNIYSFLIYIIHLSWDKFEKSEKWLLLSVNYNENSWCIPLKIRKDSFSRFHGHLIPLFLGLSKSWTLWQEGHLNERGHYTVSRNNRREERHSWPHLILFVDNLNKRCFCLLDRLF